MDHNSSKFDKEDLELQRLLKDVLGVSNKRPSGSVRKDVLQKNFAKITKSIDLPSTSKGLSVTSKVVEEEGKEEKESKKGTSSESVTIEKKSKENVQFDLELERLRRTLRKCHAALEPVQSYTDRRLDYYRSIANKKTSENNSRKRKYIEEESGDEELWEEADNPDGSLWTCELDRLKVNFKKLNVEK